MDDFSIIELFLQASLVVQAVMVLLLVVSIISWIVIFERYFNLNRIKEANKIFEEQFWSGKDLNEIHTNIEELSNEELIGSLRVFKSGFGEFLRLSEGQKITTEDLESVNRAIRVSLAREEESLMYHLPFLANVGSVSPYVGLFGTVWGIMNSFQSIAISRNTSLAIVAPGIAEALFATALGLLAAIPAVVAYNKFNNDAKKYSEKLENFSKRLLTII